MSAFGIFHTAVSVLPIGLGGYALLRNGAIDPQTRIGKLYLLSMLIGSVTALGFLATRGFSPGQVLTLLTLATLTLAVFTLRGERRASGFVQTAALTFSFFLLMIFTTTETLTRFPKDKPFAASAEAPELLPVRIALLALFLFGLGLQLRTLAAVKKAAAVVA